MFNKMFIWIKKYIKKEETTEMQKKIVKTFPNVSLSEAKRIDKQIIQYFDDFEPDETNKIQKIIMKGLDKKCKDKNLLKKKSKTLAKKYVKNNREITMIMNVCCFAFFVRDIITSFVRILNEFSQIGDNETLIQSLDIIKCIIPFIAIIFFDKSPKIKNFIAKHNQNINKITLSLASAEILYILKYKILYLICLIIIICLYFGSDIKNLFMKILPTRNKKNQ